MAGLKVELTAALGKRTKYQRDEHAQLFLYAKSSLQFQSRETQPRIEPVTEGEPVSQSEWQHSQWEIGRRLVTENKSTGEEVALREVLLDAVDGGPDENILFEGGPKFSDNVNTGSDTLHPVDQAIILALCLDVSNSNPQVWKAQ